jgi:hypothetical protein
MYGHPLFRNKLPEPYEGGNIISTPETEEAFPSLINGQNGRISDLIQTVMQITPINNM